MKARKAKRVNKDSYKLNTHQFIEALSKRTNIHKDDVEQLLIAFQEETKEVFQRGGRICIRGFLELAAIKEENKTIPYIPTSEGEYFKPIHIRPKVTFSSKFKKEIHE